MDQLADKCGYPWNPGAWPYITRCARNPQHRGDHESRTGHTSPQQRVTGGESGRRIAAGQAVIDVLLGDHADKRLIREKHHALAVQWPALAAVLNGLMEAYEVENPHPSFRRAETAVQRYS